jgi:hypothetical protein
VRISLPARGRENRKMRARAAPFFRGETQPSTTHGLADGGACLAVAADSRNSLQNVRRNFFSIGQCARRDERKSGDRARGLAVCFPMASTPRSSKRQQRKTSPRAARAGRTRGHRPGSPEKNAAPSRAEPARAGAKSPRRAANGAEHASGADRSERAGRHGKPAPLIVTAEIHAELKRLAERWQRILPRLKRRAAA